MGNLLNILASTPDDIEGDINSFSIRIVAIASILLIFFLIISALTIRKKRFRALKLPLFVIIASVIVLPTSLLIGSTIYLNTVSESKGPVHWHTDIEFWVCGEEIELRDPYQFLSNKVGTASYHEHDDKRMHLEGVVVEKDYDASLKKFMDVVGGSVTQTSLSIPTNADDIFENDIDGDQPNGSKAFVESLVDYGGENRALISVNNLMNCQGQTDSHLQTFLFRYSKESDTYTQTKLADPSSYIMRDESVVPPGDCVIVEFDTLKERTDRLCQQYGVRDAERCTEFGVHEYKPDLCSIQEVSTVEQYEEGSP